MLASALNLQLGWGAKWKGLRADMAFIFPVLHLVLESPPHFYGIYLTTHEFSVDCAASMAGLNF
jgi:hypothetical protein